MSRWTQADVARLKAPGGISVLPTKETRSKYGNTKTRGFASAREAKRAQELKLLEKAGEIAELKEQVTFELIPKQTGERSCKYIADFTYRDIASNVTVVEDVKGYANAVWRIKKKLMLHVHGIRVRET